MKLLRNWQVLETRPHGAELLVDGRHRLLLSVLDEAMIRVTLLKDGALRNRRTWSVCPGEERSRDVPWRGRDRRDLSGFACPPFEMQHDGDSLRIETPRLRVGLGSALAMTFEARQADGTWRKFAEDRATGAYMLGVNDHRHAHFLLRTEGERVDGLGEKAGDLERSGRRYEMRNLDAMGYDARATDPLYKHIPFTVTRTAGAGAYGLFYDNLASSWFDLGNEIDNYHLPFRAYRAEDGDLDYYLFWERSVLDVVKRQAWLTGGTAFPPRWSLGYSGSTMAYTDADNAQEQLEGFVRLVGEHAIPCDSFQMSSGYTSIAGKRYVFNWNREKVPDPAGMARVFADAGIHLAANIKPCLLRDHPLYDEAADAGLFVRDSEADGPQLSPFWGDEGSHLDFTNPATIAWWKANVTEQLLDVGIGSTWNDNNEFEIWDSKARCHGFGEEIDIGLVRPLQPVLMTRASFEAQQAHAPGKRPYLISRSGSPGLQRYAQTWTGDNRTSWETLRYNIRMGLGLSLSGFFNIGHDTGGFAGPRPDPELFVRWVQNGIFHPRFTIHSWNDDGTVNEPWMYPEATALVRDAIGLRYRLLPYLYTLLYRAAHEGEPILRPTFLDHENDPRAFDETDDFLLGRDLLVASVVDPGVTERRVYLPDNGAGWRDFHSGTWHAGGQEIAVPVALDSIPLFVRAGAVIPLAGDIARCDPAMDRQRVFAAFPVPGSGAHVSLQYEDDGDGVVASGEDCRLTRIELVSDDTSVRLAWHHDGAFRPAYDRIEVTLPAGEERRHFVQGVEAASGQMHPFETA